MSEEQNTKRNTKETFGIKHVKFNNHGTNGQSHRKGYVKKHLRGLKNRDVRAMLNASRGTTGASLYHSQLEALSKGLAG